jgi:two-component system, NarL family, response regulator NreC
VHETLGVLVVDPHPAMRGALRAALELEDGIRVAGEAGDMFTALRDAADSRIAVALVDSRLAGLQSPLALDALGALARRVRLVVMGMGDPELYAASYVEAGASGYWAKDGDLTALVALLRAAVTRRPAA